MAHYQLLAHAGAVKLYRSKYQQEQGGKIGITFNSGFNVPRCKTDKDKEAAQRAMEFVLGWYADPVFKGNPFWSVRWCLQVHCTDLFFVFSYLKGTTQRL